MFVCLFGNVFLSKKKGDLIANVKALHGSGGENKFYFILFYFIFEILAVVPLDLSPTSSPQRKRRPPQLSELNTHG